jgi:hypothetical protein
MTATETGMIASPSRAFMVVPYPSGPGLLRPGLRFHISPQDVDDRDNPRIKSGDGHDGGGKRAGYLPAAARACAQYMRTSLWKSWTGSPGGKYPKCRCGAPWTLTAKLGTRLCLTLTSMTPAAYRTMPTTVG